MNWPNRLTIARIILVPILVMFLLTESIQHRFLFSAIIFVVASVTDHVDGQLARKYNQITNFGKFADPLADKILVISSLVCFIQLGIISALPVIIIIAREFLVTSIRLVAAEKGDVISANSWGKFKTVSQLFSILAIIVVLHLERPDLLIYCRVSVWVSTFLTAISGAIYLKDNVNIIKNVV